MFGIVGKYLFELRGEALVLLRERRDEQALLLLRLPLLVPVLVEVRLQHLQVLLQLTHLQVVLLLDGVEPPPQVVLLLLQFLKGICKIWSLCQSVWLVWLIGSPHALAHDAFLLPATGRGRLSEFFRSSTQ